MNMIKTGTTSKNILAYFIESRLWKQYLFEITDNYNYWCQEEPDRARRMYAARGNNKKGYLIEEYIYDMLDCTYKSKLKNATKVRIYEAIDQLELYHELKGSLKEEL